MVTAAVSPEQEVYDVLSTMLVEGIVAPGAKLGEKEIADAFGVSRERVRKVLVRLGSERKVELIRNRGAFVPEVSLETAREAFDARRILEAGLVHFLASRLSSEQLAQLDEQVRSERVSVGAKGKGDAVRDSFHTRLAKLTRNKHVQKMLEELIARTAPLSPRASGVTDVCGHREHEPILAALRAKDAAMSADLIVAHLALMETRLESPRGVSASESSVGSLIKNQLQDRRPVSSGKPRSAPRVPAKKRT